MSLSLPFLLSSLVLFFALLFLVVPASGATATIDDTKGDSMTGVQPVYLPANAFSLNSDCSACLAHPDPAQAFDGTWHDSSQLEGGPVVSVTLSFTGTGIDVFCILANTVPGAVTSTDLSFTLDDVPQPSFSHTPDSSTDYIYGATVFSASELEQVPHQLVVATNPPSGSPGSLFLFDFARYTFDDGIVSSASNGLTTSTPTTTSSTISTQIVLSPSQVVSTQTVSVTIQNETVGASVTSPSLSSRSITPTSSGSSSNGATVNVLSSALPAESTRSTSPSIFPGPSSHSPGAAAQNGVLGSTSAKHTAVLVGVLVPVLLIALLGSVAFFLWRRRRAVRNGNSDPEADDFVRVAPVSGSHLSSSTIPSTMNAAEVLPVTVFDATGAARDIPFHEPSQNISAVTEGMVMREMDGGPIGSITTPSPSTLPAPSEIFSNSYSVPEDPPPCYDSDTRRIQTSPPSGKVSQLEHQGAVSFGH